MVPSLHRRKRALQCLLLFFLGHVGSSTSFLIQIGSTSKYSHPLLVLDAATNSDNPNPNTNTNTPTTSRLIREQTYEEQLLQEFWDQDPFHFATKIVSAVIEEENHPRPLLIPAVGKEGTSVLPVAPSDSALFCRLFGTSDMLHVANTTSEMHPKPNQKAFQSFALEIAYRGEHFCGWQTQPNNLEMPSVQQTLEDWLHPLYQPSRKADPEKRVNLRTAGRTDAGVHALGQIVRFRTWNKQRGDERRGGEVLEEGRKYNPQPSSQPVDMAGAIHRHINQHPMAAGSSFRCLSVTPVSWKFHPTFGATCRAYVYLIDAEALDSLLRHKTDLTITDIVKRMDAILSALENQELDYIAMSYGKIKTQTTICTLLTARAFLVRQANKEHTGHANHEENNDVKDSGNQEEYGLCVQLVGSRFLRRMVRILVATALREALSMKLDGHCDGDEDGDARAEILFELLESKDRSNMARPAPPHGLVFVGAAFDEY